jgi:dATP pyrophosphohydrolase
MPYKQPTSALIIIYTATLQVLLLKRADFPLWQSVTGSVEGEESIQQTAMREIYEETGISLPQILTLGAVLTDWQWVERYLIYKRWQHRYAPGTRYNTEHIFGLQLPKTMPITLAKDEHVDYQWTDWQIAADLVFSPSNAQAIRALPEKII